MKKSQIAKWFESRKEITVGRYINAEERNDDDAMQRNDDKITAIDEILSLLDEI